MRRGVMQKLALSFIYNIILFGVKPSGLRKMASRFHLSDNKHVTFVLAHLTILDEVKDEFCWPNGLDNVIYRRQRG